MQTQAPTRVSNGLSVAQMIEASKGAKGQVNLAEGSAKAAQELSPEKLAKIKALQGQGGDRLCLQGCTKPQGEVVAKIKLPAQGPKPSAEEVAAMKAKIEGEHQPKAWKPTTLPNFEAIAKLKDRALSGENPVSQGLKVLVNQAGQVGASFKPMWEKMKAQAAEQGQ